MKNSLPFRRVGTAHQRLYVICRFVVGSAHPTYSTLVTRYSLLVLLVVGLTGCGPSEAKQAAAKGAKGGGSRPSALVSLNTVEKRSVRPRIVVVGTVTPRAVSVVASGATGIVTDFSLEHGQFVRAGDVLSVLRMKTTDLELSEAITLQNEREQKWIEMQKSRKEDIIEADAQMRAAQAVKENAAQKLKRTQEAASQNVVNADELDDAIERAKAAEEAFLAAKANSDRVKAGPRIEQREQARFSFEAQKQHVAWLQAEKEKRTTKAPFDGFIVKKHTFAGMWLSKGDPIVTLTYLDQVDVVVNVDQRDLHNIQIGQQAEIRFPGYELTRIETKDEQEIVGVIRNETPQSIDLVTSAVVENERASRRLTVSRSEIAKQEQLPWRGKIVSIVPKSEWETGSRGFPVVVRVRNYFDTISTMSDSPEQNGSVQNQPVPILKEGMMAEVSFEGPALDALMVPKDALVRTTRGINIFVFFPVDNKAGSQGRTVQFPVELGISEGEWIQVHPKNDDADSSIPFGPGTKVVVEGGERLQPVQERVQAVSRSSSGRG